MLTVHVGILSWETRQGVFENPCVLPSKFRWHKAHLVVTPPALGGASTSKLPVL